MDFLGPFPLDKNRRKNPRQNSKRNNPLRVQATNWLEIITSRDAQSACFQGSQASCTEIISGVFLPKFDRKISHHEMDASCCFSRFSNRFSSRT